MESSSLASTPCKSYDSVEDMGNDYYDVGIIGVWYGENYGSTLTYFALQRVLRDMGFSCIMLDKAPSKNDSELDQTIHPRVFAAKHYQAIAPRLPYSRLSELNDHCGAYIVGSDQVWNYGISKGFGKSFYLDFAGDSNKKISYATSFGHNKSFTPMEAISDVTRLLHRFDAISVRENTGLDILKNEFDIIGTQVLDPVFLLDRSVYRELAERAHRLSRKRYVLAYILDPTPEIGQAIKDFAKRQELELVVMLDARGDKRGSTENFEKNKRIIGVKNAIRCKDAPQWLRAIMDAEFVITDSFHGGSFSLIFQKQFVLLSNSGRGAARMNSLADLFKIHANLVRNGADLASVLKVNPVVDYDTVNRTLQAEKTFSKNWLSSAVSGKKAAPSNISCVSKKECCGCSSCYSICPVNAIQMAPDDEGFLYPLVDDAVCINCRKCLRACPSLNPRYEKWKIPAVFAAYTADPVRDVSSSGGLFSLLAQQVFEQGGYVCGAAFDDDFELSQRFVKAESELGPLRMSKYMQSFVKDTYKEAKGYLEEGRPVLYVGCPCQIAGLNSFLDDSLKERLLTVDLLCHGGPSQRVFKDYLDEAHADKQIEYVGFRDKDYYGWSTEMTVRYRDGQTYRAKRDADLFYRAFLPCYSVRPHCQVCNYSRLPRQGDITLGDFWGVSRYNKDYSDDKGTSIVSVNSRKGLGVMHALSDRLDVFGGINLQYILEHGQPFARPFKNTSLRSRFFKLTDYLSLEKAIECCSTTVFDVGMVGLRADSLGEILEQYAAYAFLAQNNYSVLAVKYPTDGVLPRSSLEHMHVEFLQRHFPCLSANRLEEDMVRLEKTCRSLFAMHSNDVQQSGAVNAIGTVCMDEIIPVNPIFLADSNRLAALSESCVLDLAHDSILLMVRDAASVEAELTGSASLQGLQLENADSTMSVEQLIGMVSTVCLLVTDDFDAFALAIALDRPALILDASDDAKLQIELLALSAYEPSRYSSLLEGVTSVIDGHPHDAIDTKFLAQCSQVVLNNVETAIREFGTRVGRGSEEKGKRAAQAKGNSIQKADVAPVVRSGIAYLKQHGVVDTARKVKKFARKRLKPMN